MRAGEWGRWWNARTSVEKLVVAWMVVLTVFCATTLHLHGKATQLGLRSRVATGKPAEGGGTCPKTEVQQRPRLAPLQPLRAQAKIALLVLFYNRRDYLRQTMESILKRVPRDNFPIVLSQDGDVEGMADFVRQQYVEPGLAIHVQRRERRVRRGPMKTYKYIADHYRFALGQVFDVLRFDTAVVLEDDMLVAPDFFEYFAALAPMLHADESLLCVSAWNDNGLEGLVDPASEREAGELRRTSVFPGLGWMLTRALWDQELRDKWPGGFWDDWLREPEQTRGRDCIFPAVSRTQTIGRVGSSVGQFYNDYLARIVLNRIPVDWEREPLDYLRRDEFRQRLQKQVAAAATVGPGQLRTAFAATTSDLRIFFRGEEQYKRIADTLGLMNDLKAGLPRSSFEGVVRVLTPKRAALFIVPQPSEKNTREDVTS